MSRRADEGVKRTKITQPPATPARFFSNHNNLPLTDHVSDCYDNKMLMECFAMKKTLLFFISFSWLVINISYAVAGPTACNGTRENPCIVQDTVLNSPTVKNWRDTKEILEATQKNLGNSTGLDTLWISGSGAPSAEGFKNIKKNIQQATGNKAKIMIDVDLRQESHGYLNKNAITLASENDWINFNKTNTVSEQDEQKWLASFSTRDKVENVLTPTQFKSGKFTSGKNYLVKEIVDEKMIATAADFQYFRLMVSDHMAPRDEEVDRFVMLVKNQKPYTWVHIHCRGGNGRTTTFMTMYDMLHNADKVSLDDIVKRQASVPPYYNVLETTHEDPLLTKYYEKRAAFIRKFYLFSQAYLKDKSLSWSSWSKTQ